MRDKVIFKTEDQSQRSYIGLEQTESIVLAHKDDDMPCSISFVICIIVHSTLKRKQHDVIEDLCDSLDFKFVPLALPHKTSPRSPILVQKHFLKLPFVLQCPFVYKQYKTFQV